MLRVAFQFPSRRAVIVSKSTAVVTARCRGSRRLEAMAPTIGALVVHTLGDQRGARLPRARVSRGLPTILLLCDAWRVRTLTQLGVAVSRQRLLLMFKLNAMDYLIDVRRIHPP